ncbi:MAG: hypothetical protein ACLFVQ_13515 [Chitinispirillaceae bacterium]
MNVGRVSLLGVLFAFTLGHADELRFSEDTLYTLQYGKDPGSAIAVNNTQNEIILDSIWFYTDSQKMEQWHVKFNADVRGSQRHYFEFIHTPFYQDQFFTPLSIQIGDTLVMSDFEYDYSFFYPTEGAHLSISEEPKGWKRGDTIWINMVARTNFSQDTLTVISIYQHEIRSGVKNTAVMSQSGKKDYSSLFFDLKGRAVPSEATFSQKRKSGAGVYLNRNRRQFFLTR